MTRDRERQENIFQELQHAIDYLDHAPAGFFSVDANGDIGYLNATLAAWLDHDLAQVGSGGLEARRHRLAGDGAALLTTLAAAPGEVKTEVLDLDFKTRGGRTLPVRLFHKVAFGADGAPGASRTLVLNRARDEAADPQRAAEVRFMRFFQNDADGDRHRRQGRHDRAHQCAVRAPVPWRAQGRCGTEPKAARSSPSSPSATASRSKPRSARRPTGRATSPPVDAALIGRRRALRPLLSSRAVEEDERDGEAAIVYALETTEQRTLENQVQRRRRRWSRSASSPAASRTTSTTCSPPS